jgi:myosin heavy subunit
MELEISNLRAQLAKSASGTSLEKEQIAALEEKLARTQKSLTIAENSLSDLKKNLDRTTEKAVKEGSERTSAETKLRALGQEAQEAKDHAEALQKKVDALEKKVAALTTLHKEHDARSQALKKENEKSAKDLADLRNKVGSLENDNSRLRDELERSRKAHAQGVDDEGVDELESEERHKLERKICDLESEVFDLKRGLWKDGRKEIDGESSTGAQFTDIDLGAASPGSKRRSAQAKGLSDLFQSGLNALTGAHDDLLEDDDGEFDEEAFRKAHEEEARKRMEKVREVKRGLPAWKNWRLDLVEARRGAEFGGEIFEV